MATPSFESRLRAAWLCKNIGGTLGAPYEGHTGFLHLDYYDPVPVEPAANDDLDLQLVWLQMIRRHGLFVEPRHFAECWERNITYHISEYHIAQRNLRRGLLPPSTGAFDNWFAAGMGAIIRTELWACIAPDDPLLAALYAYMDASVDHWGEGVHAAVFFAALESIAFRGGDILAMVPEALRYIPPTCDIARGVRMAMELRASDTPLHSARMVLCAHFAHAGDFTHSPLNVAFIILGLAYGSDFASAMCAAVNCGYDTDCTAASVASLYGIAYGEECIPREWIRPIGEDIKQGWGIVEVGGPSTISELCAEISALREQAASRRDELVSHLLRWTGLQVSAQPHDGEGQVLAYPAPHTVALECGSACTIRWMHDGAPTVKMADGAAAPDLLRGTLVLENQLGTPQRFAGAVLLADGEAVDAFDLVVEPHRAASIPIEASARGLDPVLRVRLDEPSRPDCSPVAFVRPRAWRILDIPSDDAAAAARIEQDGRLPNEDARIRVEHHAGDSATALVPPAGTARYAEVDLAVDEDTRTRLVLNSNGPIAGWLDGRRIVEKPHFSTGFAPSAHLQYANPGTRETAQNNGYADLVLPAGTSTLLVRLAASREAADAIVLAMRMEDVPEGLPAAARFKPFVVDPFDRAAARQASAPTHAAGH